MAALLACPLRAGPVSLTPLGFDGKVLAGRCARSPAPAAQDLDGSKRFLGRVREPGGFFCAQLLSSRT